jgi:flavin-dependent dehydrogenase
MKEDSYDVVIAGGSFAGLAVANYISEGRKLLLEQERELGAKQRSTCGAPVHWIKELEAGKSILKTFDIVTLHSGKGHEAVVELEKPYCTIDYGVFCQSLASKLENTEILTGARVIDVKNRGPITVSTDESLYTGRVVVDCTGWRAVLARALRPGFSKNQGRIAGIETEAPYDDTGSIHLYFGSRFIPGGYAWVFPTSRSTARVGLGSMRPRHLIRFHKEFLKYLGIDAGGHDFHGGLIPCSGLRSPVVEEVFLVGDAAGQVLPVSAEGIRKTFDYAKICGGLINRVLNQELELHQALASYEEAANRERRFYDTMHFIQGLVYRAPDWVFDNAIKKLGRDRELTQKLLDLYMSNGLAHPRAVILAGLLRLSLGL